MADVEISYNNSVIASLSDSGTEVLDTNGKFLVDDITITYTKSGGENVASNIVYVDYEYTHTETSSATISTWVLNKTAQELLDLLTSGNIVFIKRDGTSSYYQLVGVQRESNGTAGVTYSFPCLNNNPNHLGTYNYVPVLYPGYTVINLTDYPTYTSSIATGGSND